MGLNVLMLDAITKLKGSGKALSAGYPDVLVPTKFVKQITGKDIPARPDSQEIINWHRLTIEDIPCSISLFKELGYSLEVIDIHASRGVEKVVDLNQPVDYWQGLYDLVIDPGTIEHCFNVAQAAMNLASMVKVGGYIIHSLPMSTFNHGFYNINPTWVHSFYGQNGFKVEKALAYTKAIKGQGASIFEPPAHQRFVDCPNDVTMLVVAKRITNQKLAYPTQQKYLDTPELKVAAA
jgi:hypothetical protein